MIPGSDGVLGSADDARARRRARSASRCCSRPRTAAAGAACGSRARPARSRPRTPRRRPRRARRSAATASTSRSSIEGGRHVEIQVFADRYGHAVHLGERDCTVQRNHQKLIEESPSPAITAEQRARDVRGRRARRRARSATSAPARWRCCSTDGALRFMEMNCRLQVEHTVSEMRTRQGSRDRAARDRGRPAAAVDAGRASRSTGHVIECRINAEDPRERLRAGARHDHRVATADAATASASTPTSTPATSCRRSTTRCSRR